MTATDAISIIKAAKENGVGQLKLGELELSFGSTVPIAVEDPAIKAQNQDSNELKIKAEQLEELRLRDPHLYESIMALEINP